MPNEEQQKLNVAADEAVAATWEWAANAGQFAGAFSEGVIFLGYAYLAELTQRPEYRIISEVIAEEMTREWIEFKSSSGEDKSEKIKELEKAIKGYRLQDLFKTIAEYDGYMGRSHLFVDLGDPDTGESYEKDSEEMLKSIGNGRNRQSQSKVKKGSLIAFRPVEAMWVYPTRYGSFDPLAADWYNPTTWLVVGREVHCTRLLTFVGRPVPDMLKPAYSFGGLSLSQMAKPYVDNWLRTRQSVSDLITNFSVPVLQTLLGTSIQSGGEQLFERLELFNDLRDNQGVMALDKATEDFKNVSAPLGTLDTLQAQTQEHLFSVSRIPAVKFSGIQPHGLNASSEGEIRSFYDTIAARQIRVLSPHLQSCIDFIQLSLWGAIDEDLVWDWKPLWQQDAAGESAIEKTKADIDDAYLAAGVLKPIEVRTRLAEDPKSIYSGLSLDPEDVPEQPDMGMGGPGGESEGEEGEAGPANLSPPKDKGNRFATGVTEQAAKFGGPDTEGFSAHDSKPVEFDRWVAGYALDEAEFKEELHPRDSGGKFTKGSGFAEAKGPTHVKHAVGKVLKGYGYKPAGMTEGGHHKFEHESGHKVYVGAATPGQGGELGVTGYRSSGEHGQGAGKLAKHLEALHGAPVKAEATPAKAEKPAGGKPVPKPDDWNPLVSGENYAEMTKALLAVGIKEKEVEGLLDNTGGVAATLKNGNMLATSKGTWTIFDKNIKKLATGPNMASLYNYLADEPQTTQTQPKPKTAKSSKEISLPIGAKVLDGPNSLSIKVGGKVRQVEKYKLAPTKNHNDVRAYLAKDGYWAITADGYTLATGEGQAKFDAAFEALHPRDTSGKFIKKPEDWDPLTSGETYVEMQNVLLAAGVDENEIESFLAGENPVYLKDDTLLDAEENGSWRLLAYTGQKLASGSTWVSLYHYLGGKEATAGTTTAPATQPKKSVGDTLNFEGMKQVGPQLGSNPGGLYEDAKGDKFYIKKPLDNDHSKNELLAAALFGAAGGDTLKYHQVVDGLKLYVGTDWQNLAANNVSQLTSTQKAQARKDFAIQAWLANWDAAGTGGDNYGVTADGKVVPLDFGGSLLYRAKGQPKGAAFGTVAYEWNTLRDPTVNKDTAALYKDMTPQELQESAKRLDAITPEQIKDLVQQYGPGDLTERQALVQKLILRKQDIAAKAAATGQQASASPQPQAQQPKAAEEHYPVVHGSYSTWNKKYTERLDTAPKPTTAEGKAVNQYSGGAYNPWNAALRKSFGKDSAGYPTKALRDYLAKASWQEDGAIVTRKVSGAFAEYLMEEAAEDVHFFVDHGFASSDHWSGPLTLKIKLPKGAQAAAIGRYSSHPNENEILIQAGSRYRIDKYDPQTATMEVSLVRSGHPKTGGVHHEKVKESE